MTRPLRRRHLQVWVLLALVLPLLFFAALAVRVETTPLNRHFDWERLR